MDTADILENSEAGIVRGGAVILFRHNHWFFLGTQASGERRNIVSVHVMSPKRARATLAETPSAKPKSYAELGTNFRAEVAGKVLPTAASYLPLLRSGAASLAAGMHTDTIQQATYNQARERQFLEVLSDMMSKGEPGACLYFPGNAL
jgi:hypothetical protein